MKKKKTDAVHVVIRRAETAADIRYLCGVEPPETALLVKKNRKVTLVVAEMEYSRIKRCIQRNVAVKTPEQIGSSWQKGPADWVKKLVPDRSLIIHKDFPYSLAKDLNKNGYQLNLSNEPLCPQREVKTASEIQNIHTSQRAAVMAMKAAIQQIASARIGKNKLLQHGKTVLTAEKVRATIGHVLLDLDYTAEETIVACGAYSADPHERGSGLLFAGQPIVIDIFPKSGETGYWGDITRTVCRGPAPTELKKMYNAVKAGQVAALKAIKAGAWTHKIHNAAAEEMKRRGYQTGLKNGILQGFIHGTGHGVGLEIHEAPRVSSTNHQKLRVGHVITIEPGLYYSELGGIRIEDLVMVTKDGYKMLAPCFRKFEI
jgi:Xaa-Pro aminopeptidase